MLVYLGYRKPALRLQRSIPHQHGLLVTKGISAAPPMDLGFRE
jgi:hypothetical protein